MPKEDNVVDPGVDVQVISVPTGGPGGQISIPSPSQSGNGVVVMPLSQIGALPQSAQGPAVILITVGAKKDEKKDEKKSSSVFQRL
jgi:hypothetical protein